MLELRHALEPWHVLGEDATAAPPRVSSIPRSNGCVGGGFNAARHAVACNGRLAPLTSTGRPANTSPACVSRRGRLSALQPTIDVHAPLTFDIIDRWNRARSAAASTTSPIPADATTRPSRSTPTRRRRGAWRASRITAIRRDSSICLGKNARSSIRDTRPQAPDSCLIAAWPANATGSSARTRRWGIAGGLSAAARHIRRDGGPPRPRARPLAAASGHARGTGRR